MTCCPSRQPPLFLPLLLVSHVPNYFNIFVLFFFFFRTLRRTRFCFETMLDFDGVGWGGSLLTLKRWRDLRHFLFVFQECAERQCFENEIHFARLAAPLVIATWAWQSHICRRKKPSFSSSSFITLSFFFRLLYVVGLSPFREITGELGNRERWDAPTFIISFKFNLKFLFDRLRSPAIG